MDRRRQGHAGKILSLLEVIDNHEEAVRADLIRIGLRLTDIGTEAMSWEDFHAWIRYADPKSAVYRSREGHSWSIETAILANLYDVMIWLLYAFIRSKGGRMRKPKPFPRPEALTPATEKETENLGTAHDVDDVKAFLERKNGR